MNKPGWKTTEFWMTAIFVVASAAASSGVFGGEDSSTTKFLGLIAAGIAAAGYSVARGMMKRGNPSG